MYFRGRRVKGRRSMEASRLVELQPENPENGCLLAELAEMLVNEARPVAPTRTALRNRAP